MARISIEIQNQQSGLLACPHRGGGLHFVELSLGNPKDPAYTMTHFRPHHGLEPGGIFTDRDYDQEDGEGEPNPRRATALHEAGHAVASRALGGRLRYIEIGMRKTRRCQSLGRVAYKGWPPGGDIDQATVSLAGCAAEHLADYPVGDGGWLDQRDAQAYLGPNAHLAPVLSRRAEAILSANWRYVRALAAVLWRRSRLTATDFNCLTHDWRFGPPDRVTITGADDQTRLLLYSLIYPENPDQISPDWVQETVETLCPDLNSSGAVDLLHRIAEGLKNTHPAWSHLRGHDETIAGIALIQSLSVAAERLAGTHPVLDSISMTPPRDIKSRAEELRALITGPTAKERPPAPPPPAAAPGGNGNVSGKSRVEALRALAAARRGEVKETKEKDGAEPAAGSEPPDPPTAV